MNYLDMLAKLGIGSAHPGGFTATLELLDTASIGQQARILEVGCGTGRTACHLARLGYQVTAVDIRSDMLMKARHRAEQEQVQVNFVQGNVEHLPFDAGSFDVVLAESVTLFADTLCALREYARVLAPGGRLYDREMIALQSLEDVIARRVSKYYGVGEVWTAEQWIELLEQAGLREIDLLQPGKLNEFDWSDEMEHPDMSGVVDASVYFDQRIWDLTREYDDIMYQYKDQFGFGVWTGVKG